MFRLPVLILGALPLAASVLATYPPGTVLENVAVAPSGDIFATDVVNGNIFEVTPAGSSRLFAHVNDGLAGIAFDTNGALYAAGLTTLYGFAGDGTLQRAATVPGARELNGLALIAPNQFLVADDTADTIWRVNAATGASTAWLTGPLLEPAPGGLPFGPNGIKVYKGSVYVSNTGTGTLLRIPILSEGAAGTPEVLISSLVIDDFAFAANGAIFAATQQGHIIRIDPDGTQALIPTGTLGDAAVAFGRTAADAHSLYVVNNGGAFLGLPGGPEPGSIVRLETDATGVVPEAQAVPEPATTMLAAVGLALGILRRCRRVPLHRG